MEAAGQPFRLVREKRTAVTRCAPQAAPNQNAAPENLEPSRTRHLEPTNVEPREPEPGTSEPGTDERFLLRPDYLLEPRDIDVAEHRRPRRQQ